MITREQLEAQTKCADIGVSVPCDRECAGWEICDEVPASTARQMLTLMDDNQRLTERNTALEAGLWMMCEEAAGHYLHSQGYAMPYCNETGGCAEPEDFDCQHHCSKARRANAWYRAAMLHAVALYAAPTPPKEEQ